MKDEAEWAKTKRLCKLSEEEVRMARELGFKPKSLIKNIPNPSQRWKAPVPVWVRSLYEARMEKAGRAVRPAPVTLPVGDEPALDWEFEDVFGDDSPPTPREIAEQNADMLREQRRFRLAPKRSRPRLPNFPLSGRWSWSARWQCP